MNINVYISVITIKIREKANLILGPFRRKRLNSAGKSNFTIISNNCWGGHVYRWFSCRYDTPTIGLYLFSEDYVKFIYNLKHYLSIEPRFITYRESKYKDILEKRAGSNIKCPIGVLDDIEVIFLHYSTAEEALAKWNRRKNRIHWDNIFFKMSEQNGCSEAYLKIFDQLPTSKKIVFTHKDYGLKSQIVFREYNNADEVIDDTTHFNRYIDLTCWLLQKDKFKKRQ